MSYTSYYNYQKYETRNGTSVPCYPATYSIDGDGTKPLVKKQDNDPNCGYIPPVEPTYRWVNLSIYTDYVCENGNKFYKQQEQVSYNNGLTWSNVSPAQYRKGVLYESGSIDCALKFRAEYADSSTFEAACDGNTSLTTATTKPSGYNYSAMTSAEVGQCIKSIGREAFHNCSGLTSVTIPNSVNEIGYDAFSNCHSLTNVTIPNSVISIGDYAFKSCSGLTSIDIPNSVTSIGNGAFNACSSLTSATIGSGVTSISDYTFYSCTSLTGVTIPDGVTSIGNRTFFYCDSLTSVTMPNSVTSIGNGAFIYCFSLTSVTIPNSVTSISNNAFYYCSSLSALTVDATTPPTLGENALNYTNDCPIYVPAQSVDAYKQASGWNNYSSRIRAIQ